MDDDKGPLGHRSLPRRLVHIAFWTALLYGLTVGIARLAEWLSGR